MDLIPPKTPKLVKALFPSYVWDIPNSGKTIYLTFDDGPTPEITEWTLNLLKRYKAKATFFCIGSNIEKYPDIFQSINDEGHSIGNHTYNHLKGWKTSRQDYIEDAKKTEQVILKYIKKHTSLFRPPYGKLTPKQGKALQTLGYNIIMWNVLSFDWDNRVSPEKCLKNVINVADSGSIIVFHDSKKAQKNLKYALPKVLDYFSSKGFEFKALS